MFYNLPVGPVIRQYVIVITANLTVFCVGLSLAWPSPVLVKLREPLDPVLSRPITEEEGSWIVSIGFLVGLIPTLISGILLNHIGRKYTLVVATIPRIVAWLIFSFATEVWLVTLGRSFGGVADIVTLTVVPIYASEIASNTVRGALGTVLQILCSLGMLTMLLIGPFLPYFLLQQICAGIACVTSLPLIFLPDSPYFLYTKGRKDEALEILTFLRGSEREASEEIIEYSKCKNQKLNKLALVKDRVFLKCLGIVCVMSIAAQLSGYNSVLFYLQSILESANTSLEPEISSVIIGFIQFIASICSTIVIDKYGRKPILITTLILVIIGMVGLGTFFTLQVEDSVIVGIMNYVPLISLVLIVFGYNAGFGAINWLLVAELFDSPTRGIGGATSVVFSTLTLFLTSKYFAQLVTLIGALTYWLFAIICGFMVVFIVYLIPETKGKSFAEIQESLGSKKEPLKIDEKA